MLVNIAGQANDGTQFSTKQLCYIAENIDCLFLSRQACRELGIIGEDFPSQKQVNFLWFEITEDSVHPAAKYLQAIQDFPKPEDITDIRSWFGLVNQVAYAFNMTSVMEPFRELLKPTSEFSWTDELDEAFKESKDVIVEAVKDGVMTFEMGRTTCLATDWFKQGMGFVLLQKYCSCKERTPICCSSGWKLVFAGSRFTSGAESRYAEVEGEALAAAYSLKKGRHFILGCKDLILAVDHKQFLNILGDKNLEDIDNPRILNLKEKTLRYSLKWYMCLESSIKVQMQLQDTQLVMVFTWRLLNLPLLHWQLNHKQHSLCLTGFPKFSYRVLDSKQQKLIMRSVCTWSSRLWDLG